MVLDQLSCDDEAAVTTSTSTITPRRLVDLGRVEHVCPFGSVNLVAGWRPAVPRRPLASLATAVTRTLEPFTDLGPHGDDATRFVAVCGGSLPVDCELVRIGDALAELDPTDAGVTLHDPSAFAWTALGGLDAATRARVVRFVAANVGRAVPHSRAVAEQLRVFHEAMREHSAPCVIAPDSPRGLFVDTLLAIDERGYYARGWMRSSDGAITSVVITAPEGGRAELADVCFRFVRPDIGEFYGSDADARRLDRPGFIAYFELDAPSRLRDGWTIALTDTSGTTVETTVPAVVDDPATVRTTILGDLLYELPPGERLLADHAFPAISRLQERNARDSTVAAVHDFGTGAGDPDVTVIVPLYRRIDFLEHQLAQFVHDPEIAAAELLYVLDSPELAEAAMQQALELHRLYRVPFRLAVMTRNVGFAGANNAAARLARGRLLLLMNSDVLPDAPGWLGRLVAFHDRTPSVGAVGPKLLYEDDSIQHAGLYFLRPDGAPWWENAHHHKGLHRAFPAANVTRPVHAVTGGCMLVARDAWERVGGLCGTYVQGDYEDSDLCLRLAGLGLANWYCSEVELYHLEGQSYATELRRLTSRYNTWLHSHLWASQIEQLDRQPVEPLEIAGAAEARRVDPATSRRRARARRTATKEE